MKYNALYSNGYIIDYKKILGKGTYGNVFIVKNILTNKIYAIKIASENEKTLINEINLLENNNLFINIYEYGNINNYNYFIMDLFEEDLNTIVKKNNSISLKKTIEYSILMLKQIKYYHDKNIIHRDIKPNNFVLYNNNIILIDFGLSVYLDNFEELNKDKYIGTARYMSINALEKKQQNKCDDLFSLGYTILYLYYGSLFWFDIYCTTDSEKNKKIEQLNKKIDIFKQDSKDSKDSKDNQIKIFEKEINDIKILKNTNNLERNKKIYKIKKNLTNNDITYNFNCKNKDCINNCICQKNMLKYFNYLDNLTNKNEPDHSFLISLFQSIIDSNHI